MAEGKSKEKTSACVVLNQFLQGTFIAGCMQDGTYIFIGLTHTNIINSLTVI